MPAQAIWWPAVAMAALTFGVWMLMLVRRLAQMRRERIAPQRVATSAQAATLLTDSRAADNFRNLFELPVLFYVALGVASTGRVDAGTLTFAWLFVAARIVHSAIQCTYNRVTHRFYAYAAGGLALWFLWARVAAGLLAQ